MDALANGFRSQTISSLSGSPGSGSPGPGSPVQRTLKASIGCVGVGLHSGRKVEMVLHPAPVGSGIVFRRTDKEAGADGFDIPARYDNVSETRLCTGLARPDRPALRVGTVEHVLAALAGCGITNALISLDGPELPILDGSAASFVFLIDCAGVADQGATAPIIEVVRPVGVAHGDAYAQLLPAPGALDLSMSIEFDAAAIG